MHFSLLNDVVLDVFGEPDGVLGVTIDGAEVRAIYDSRHYASEDGEVGTSDLITTISVRTSDLPLVNDDTVIVARGKDYRCYEQRPDGQGMTVLQLERRV